MRTKASILTVIVLAAIAFVCVGFICQGKSSMKIDKTQTFQLKTIADLTEQQQQQMAQMLAGKKVFFAHMSVGYNILDGLSQITKQYPEFNLSITETDDPAEMTGPGLYHFKLGYNTEPLKKFESFSALMQKINPAEPDLVLMKLCYVDINGETNPETLFSEYQQMIDRLQQKFSNIHFLHCTVPLTFGPLTAKETLKEVIRPLLGKATTATVNQKRNQYNQLLITAFGQDHVFDIAAFESITPQGHPCTHAGNIPVLFTDYTTDGGHLNETGQKYLGEQFLLTLAQNEK